MSVSVHDLWGVNTFACGFTQVVVVIYVSLNTPNKQRLQYAASYFGGGGGLSGLNSLRQHEKCRAVMKYGVLCLIRIKLRSMESMRVPVLLFPDH